MLVFFVLSGLVVALPALRKGFSWRAYYPARLARLYLPIWGSLALAAALVLLIPRPPAKREFGLLARPGEHDGSPRLALAA